MKVKYYVVKTVDDLVVRITERKATKRNRNGQFTGNRHSGGFCRYYSVCPFTTKGE